MAWSLEGSLLELVFFNGFAGFFLALWAFGRVLLDLGLVEEVRGVLMFLLVFSGSWDDWTVLGRLRLIPDNKNGSMNI